MIMRRILFIIICNLLLLPVEARKITVLQWNIWQEGTMVKGGYEAIVTEIARLRPDFVTLSEVRNYHDTNFTRRLCESLRQKGLQYYSFKSYDTGLLSRYPIEDSLVVFPLNCDHGSIHKLTATVEGRKVNVYTAHLDYLNDAYYNVRGYDGSTWKEVTPPATVEELLRLNDLSWRDDAIRVFLNEARHDIAAGDVVVVGGDFNEPSWQDWTASTAQLYNHRGFVVPWTVSKLLTDAGFKDAYRELHPDVLRFPGFTYPSYNAAVPSEKITWAPNADERDRIDYIFYKGEGLRAVSAKVFGPDSCVCRSKAMPDLPGEPVVKPIGTWPTDHKGVLVEMNLESRHGKSHRQ